jgi:hypothetical protein
VPENALDAACSPALNGNRNAITLSTDATAPDTAVLGTSATNAIGSDTRNAISEAALTSRAMAPTATPSAPKARPLTASASTHSSTRAHSRCTNSDTSAAIARVTTVAHPAASTTFSDSSRPGVTSPRTNREYACSLRSSASIPAASSIVTNISETITAMEAAYASVGVVRPANWVCWTVSGVPIEPSTGLAKPSPWIARSAKLTTWPSATRRPELRGSEASVPATIVRALRSPSSRTVWPRICTLPPLSTSCRSVTATRSTCLDTSCSTWASRDEIAWSTNWRWMGSFVFRYSCTVGLPIPCVIRLCTCCGRSAGMISAASASPLRTLAIACAREWTLISWMELSRSDA